MIVIEKGNAVCVDHNDYDLSLTEAAQELFEGRNVIAREFEDYSDESELSFPEVDNLIASDYTGKSIEQIIESIRGCYESFGRAHK